MIFVSRAQKISTVVDFFDNICHFYVSRAQKISTVVDTNVSIAIPICFTRSKNFYCCRFETIDYKIGVSRAQKISTVVDGCSRGFRPWVSRAQKISTVVDPCAS